MRKYHFKLVDTHFVADYGSYELVDKTAAQIEAIRLAQSLRETRPDLIGQHCSIRSLMSTVLASVWSRSTLSSLPPGRVHQLDHRAAAAGSSRINPQRQYQA